MGDGESGRSEAREATPRGIITFLLTDVQDSTQGWERAASSMAAAVARHEQIVADSVATFDGTLIKSKGEGDSTFSVFGRASDALAAALAIQRGLASEEWPTETPIKSRIGIHTGEAQARDGDYFGPAVNRCARLRATASGGQIVLSKATLDVSARALPDGAAVKDLGLHRLKDLREPEHVFQLLHPELPSEFPPLRSLDVVLHNLPIQLKSFVPRDAELTQVVDRVGRHRLVTLTGAGGSGKTRLALQAAAEMLELFPDGVWLVDLATLSDADLLVQHVASTIGLPAPQGAQSQESARPLLERIIEHLAGRNALLIMDNCEHVLDAAGALLSALLSSCPDLKILVTSREPLGIDGEVPWRVPSLSIPQHATIDEVEASQSVRLFLDRARIARSDFELKPSNVEAVAEIVRRLDGIPLAIELAAARVKMLSPEQIASMLDDQFRILTGGAKTALERQQTLRASVDWSYTYLSEPEQALLQRLSVFAGGATLDAIQRVAETKTVDGDLFDLIGHLVDKSLLEFDGERYRMLETIRQYAREKLQASGDAAEARDAHADHYRAVAARIGDGTRGGDERPWLAVADTEQANVRAAAEWFIGSQRGAEAIEIEWGMFVPCFLRGWLEETSALLERAVEATDDPSARALGLVQIAYIKSWKSTEADAWGDFVVRAVDELERGGDPDGPVAALAAALEPFRVLHLGSNDEAAERAERLARASGDPWVLNVTLIYVSIYYSMTGRRDRAQALQEEVVRAARVMGNRWATAAGLNLLASGAMASLSRDVALPERNQLAQKSLDSLEEVISISRELEAPMHIASTLNLLAYVLVELERYDEAIGHVREAIDICDRVGNRFDGASYMHSLGELTERSGDLETARSIYEECFPEAMRAQNRGVAEECLHGLGRIASAEGNDVKALDLFAEMVQAAPAWRVGRAIRIAAQALAPFRPREAAVAFGSHGRMMVERNLPIARGQEPMYEAAKQVARDLLGEEGFDEAWKEGWEIPLEDLRPIIRAAADEVVAEQRSARRP